MDDDLLNAPEIAKMAEDAGIQMLVVHGRTRCQFYKGEADWTAVSRTKQAVNIPVFVNGDISTPQKAEVALEQSGCDGVMLGRSLVGRPWSTLDIRAQVDGGEVQILDNQQKCEIATKHYSDSLSFYGEKKGLRVARKHLAGYVEHSDFGGDKDALKSKICRSLDPAEVKALLRETFGTGAAEQAA